MEQNVALFAEKVTDLGKTNTIKKSAGTSNHPPIKLRLYRTSFIKHPILDRPVNDM